MSRGIIANTRHQKGSQASAASGAAQRVLLGQITGNTRKVWNLALALSKECDANRKKRLTGCDLQKLLTEWKNEPKLDPLGNACPVSLLVTATEIGHDLCNPMLVQTLVLHCSRNVDSMFK